MAEGKGRVTASCNPAWVFTDWLLAWQRALDWKTMAVLAVCLDVATRRHLGRFMV